MHAENGEIGRSVTTAATPGANVSMAGKLPRGLRRFIGRLGVLGLLFSASAAAQPGTGGGIDIVVGRPIAEIIEAWRQRGVPFAYSTKTVTDKVVVKAVPEATDNPVQAVRALLEPYRLTLHEIDGLYVVGRLEVRDTARPPPVQNTPPAEPVIAEVTVSASRYEILRELLDAPSFLSQSTIRQMPVLGDDPMRAVQRLPGNATSGASAKTNLRGSEQNATALVLNGQRLLDPFHVRDYQNLFSAVDSRAIRGIEVFTGGFPVQYGDRIGGLVLIDTVAPEDRHTEIGLSVYNTSLLSAGVLAEGDIEWLLSARRGNLDLVLDKDLGEPSYNDIFAEIGINLTENSKLSVNGLVANDHVVAVTETDPEELERSTNDTRNAQFWINWSHAWSDRLKSYTTLSTSALNSVRTGTANDSEEITGRVDDRRDISVSGLQQDWTYELGDRHRLSWGAEYRRLDGQFDYSGSFDYFGIFASIEGIDHSLRRNLRATVDGDAFAMYLADRWQLARKTAAEIGIRWDRQGYTNTADDQQFSPRFSLLHALGPDTDLRLSWGRYHQSQAINELQIEDGITRFFPAQRADQYIVSLQHRFGDSWLARAEVYWKRINRLQPRFENSLDPLAVIPELKPDRVRIDPGSARARGLELSVSREGNGNVDWWATYSLSSVDDEIDGKLVPRSWDQRHAVQLGAVWTKGRWDFAAAANAHSGWPKTQLSIDPASSPDDPRLQFEPRNSSRFRPFMTLDLRLNYRAPVRIGELSLFFELSNATNRKNPCCVDIEFSEDGDAPQLIQIDEYWFPLLPAIGFLWEF